MRHLTETIERGYTTVNRICFSEFQFRMNDLACQFDYLFCWYPIQHAWSITKADIFVSHDKKDASVEPNRVTCSRWLMLRGHVYIKLPNGSFPRITPHFTFGYKSPVRIIWWLTNRHYISTRDGVSGHRPLHTFCDVTRFKFTLASCIYT